MKIIANNIGIEVVDSAPDAPHLPVVLLIMGLGMQLIAWPPGVVEHILAHMLPHLQTANQPKQNP